MYNFFTGTKTAFTEQENQEMVTLLRSSPFQEEYCNYLKHTSISNFINYHQSIHNITFITELYKKYNKQFTDPSLPFNNTSCNIDLQIEDFINLMTVRYTKGHFIIGAEFNETSYFEYYPDVGTSSGVCKTIKPMVWPTKLSKMSHAYIEFYLL